MATWIKENREVFERDVLQDFCRTSARLEEQFRRLAETGTLSFPVLRDLVGVPMKKGLLWRLKDKAHHLFRDTGQDTAAGGLLDWTLGYIFHESLKLMEDAHQIRYYAPRIRAFAGRDISPALAGLLNDLDAVSGQTVESMLREAGRLQNLFRQSRRLFCLYFAGRASSRPLARFLYDNSDIVRRTFQEDYGELLDAVYGDAPERLFVEAAYSLLESGRKDEAVRAAAAARALNPQISFAGEAEALFNDK